MVIINGSNLDIECVIDDKNFFLHSGEEIKICNPGKIELKHKNVSYMCYKTDKSKIIKVLSFIDDPFKTKNEYHININSTYDISKFAENATLIINHKNSVSDIDFYAIYEYFVLKYDELCIQPSNIDVIEKNRISQLFLNNNRKRVIWNGIWDIFIEPIVFEIVGYACIYWLFSLWIDRKAWWVILSLLCLNIFIDSIIFLFKCRKMNKFKLIMSNKNIIDNCYSIT